MLTKKQIKLIKRRLSEFKNVVIFQDKNHNIARIRIISETFNFIGLLSRTTLVYGLLDLPSSMHDNTHIIVNPISRNEWDNRGKKWELF